ncbi:MAG: hypothetical protein ACI8Y4_003685 [Candidatus Poriferisodalaceae bacterium]|jgi:hypothetical protein
MAIHSDRVDGRHSNVGVVDSRSCLRGDDAQQTEDERHGKGHWTELSASGGARPLVP